MNREKITERVEFTEEDRWNILKKTEQRCAHCGKPIFAIEHLENTMTIDHFIPLHKGGTNRMINLIPLCRECNKSKGDKVVDPESYLKFIKPKYKEEIKGYYESYVHSFNYISNQDLFAADEFIVKVPYYQFNGMRRRKLGQGHIHELKCTVKKAAYEDLDRILSFYIKYLKKYDVLDSEEIAKENITDWFEDGCIYYSERNGEISVMSAFDIINAATETGSYSGPVIEIWPFSYYNTQLNGELLSQMIMSMPSRIIQECDVPVLPVVTSVVKFDKIYSHLTVFRDILDCGVCGKAIYKCFSFMKDGYNDVVDVVTSKMLTCDEMQKMKDFMSNFEPRGFERTKDIEEGEST